jgi:hypothetical protein
MVVHKRHTSRIIYVLWTLVLIGVGLEVYFVISEHLIAALFGLAGLCALWIYPIYALTINEDSITVKRSVRLGFKTVAYTIARDSGYRGEVLTNGDTLIGSSDMDGFLNFIWLLFPFLYRSHSLWVYDLQYNKLRLLVKLCDREYDQLMWLSRLDKALPLTGAVALWPPGKRYNL